MRRMILPLVLVVCFASNAVGQATWSLPRLKELDQSNDIGKGSILLSADETSLLRKLTHRITSSCISDPGPGDPKSAEGIFKSLRVVRVDLTAKGDSALIVQGEGVCMCGAVGNCPFWLLSHGPNPKLLLKPTGIQSFSVQKVERLASPIWFLAATIPQWKPTSKSSASTEPGINAPDKPLSNGMMRAAIGLIPLGSSRSGVPRLPQSRLFGHYGSKRPKTPYFAKLNAT